MILRQRQEIFVGKCVNALKANGNTLGVGPTGAGKTIMLAATCLRVAPPDLPTLILQHRDELVTQNRDKFLRYAGGVRCVRKPMTINGETKAWDRKGGGWNFGMVQTVCRNLDSMPKLGMLAIDETHHAAADSYMDVIKAAKAQNPDLLLFGVTATPNRGDRLALRTIFDNCADQISIKELIDSGLLCKPRSYVVDIGVQDELGRVKRTAQDYDQNEVGKILNHDILHEKIIEKWRGFTTKEGVFVSCANRQTVVFCATVQHAKDFCAAMQAAGVSAAWIAGAPHMKLDERREILQRYDAGHIQVIVNVMVLTEGWDHQPTSCVILLRLSSQKGTMIQMIGRGLRLVDPAEYPGVIKDDCIVLDFGTSLLTHGNLEDETELHGSGTKICVKCESHVPTRSKECVICGHQFPIVPVTRTAGGGGNTGSDETESAGVLQDFVMSEIDILNSSPFKYESFFDGRVMICFGFKNWAAVVHYADNRYYAVGAEEQGPNNYRLVCVASADSYLIALQSADDYMRTHGKKTEANRVAQWLYEAPTDKQMDILKEGFSIGMTKYRATCAIQFKFYGGQIRGCIEGFKNAVAEKEAKYK